MTSNRPIISRRGSDGDDELLTDHSDAVGARTPTLATFSSEGSPSEEDMVECTATLHDLGKVTPQFQRHIRDETVARVRMTYHARFGAFATFHALEQLGASSRVCLAGFISVLRHHGQLPNTAADLTRLLKEEQNREGYVIDQVAMVDDRQQNRTIAGEILATASKGNSSWGAFVNAIESQRLFEEILPLVAEPAGTVPGLDRKYEPTGGNLPDTLYDFTLRIWSALTLADKTSAAGIEPPCLQPTTLTLSDLETHIKSLRTDLDTPPDLSDPDELPLDISNTDSLNQLREAIRRLVRENAEEFAAGSYRIATLTLPTGVGKTFTGLTAAYTIRNAIDHMELSTETSPRVIYALPYTSIIEQTREIFESQNVFAADPQGSAFTVHHYLSETVTYPDIADNWDGSITSTKITSPDQATDDTQYVDPALLGESWRSGTVLTTFVQLFESLTGPTNAEGLKLPALQDSVIILDEPQTLPKPWWEAIRRLIQLLVEEYNVRIISMTATQPSLLTDAPGLEMVSLLSSNAEATSPLVDSFFDAVRRVSYHVDDSVQQFKDAGDGLVDHEMAARRLLETARTPGIGDSEGQSVLSVCNTVGSATRLAETVTEATQEGEQSVTHLGSVYRRALQACTHGNYRLADEPSTIESSLRPSESAVAAETLWRLGLRPADPASTDDVPLEDQEWYPASTDQTEIYLGTLTSRIRPRDRRSLITVATVLARAEVPFVFVSTQAIEAGVDISFANVYRDIAPADSIVQAAGRCNRSFEWGQENGDVTIWVLAPVENTNDPPAMYVYQPLEQLNEVAKLLMNKRQSNGGTELAETVLTREVVPEYFEWIEQQDLERRTIRTAIEECNAADLSREHLIDDTFKTVDVIVAETMMERRLVEQIMSAFQEGDHSTAFKRLKSLSDLRISVPVNDAEIVAMQMFPLSADENVDVQAYTNAGNGEVYDIARGGFVVEEDDGISGRFTFN